MHATLNPDIRGFIDDIINDGVNATIKGWGFYYKTMQTTPPRVLADGKVYDVTRRERPDVGNAYKTQKVINCGWEFTVPNTVKSEMQMNIDGEWKTYFIFDIVNAPVATEAIVSAPAAGVIVAPTISIAAAMPTTPYAISTAIPSFLVVDNFYENPDEVRKFALTCNFADHPDYHKGRRTDACYRFEGLKERFEQLIGKKVTNWEKYGTNGCFQYCIGGDQLVYHHDGQQYAGVLYLTPDAPPQAGTSLYRSRHTKKMKVLTSEHGLVFRNGFLDETEFDLVDVVGNVYNRIILFDARIIHAASKYFGTTKENSRLFQLFFFDLEA